jgi:hypothetical protein
LWRRCKPPLSFTTPAALCHAAQKYDFPDPLCRWLDSARVVRRPWERFSKPRYGLKNLTNEFGIEFEHQKAIDDGAFAVLFDGNGEFITESFIPLPPSASSSEIYRSADQRSRSQRYPTLGK